MKTESGFTLMQAAEFVEWLGDQDVSRIIKVIQNHHTYIPAYAHFNGSNHFARLRAMRDYHVGNNGWRDIAQNFTTFPDGTIATGRPIQDIPAGIKGQNANGICIEHLGNFDSGNDEMTNAQRDTIIMINAALCKKFNLEPNTRTIVYHHWFDLNTSQRTGGSGVTKTCPGSAFFGGNKEVDAEKNFIPLVKGKLKALSGTIISEPEPKNPIKFYYHVTASNLRIRTGPGTIHKQAGLVHNGSVLPVYDTKDRWLQIDTAGKWVSDDFGLLLGLAEVKANVLNVRSGPGTVFDPVGSVKKGDEVFVYAIENNWAKTNISEQWVHRDHINMKLTAPGSLPAERGSRPDR